MWQFSSWRELPFSSQQRIGQISLRRDLLWRICNSRRILRRKLLNIPRELLISSGEFSNSRHNFDENCWIRGQNPAKSRQLNCIYFPVVAVDEGDNLQRAENVIALILLSAQGCSLQRWSMTANAQANCPPSPSQSEKVKLFPSEARTQPPKLSFLKPSQ